MLPNDFQEPPYSEFVRVLILNKARRLSQLSGFGRSHLEDLEQELLAYAWEKYKQFDATRGHPDGFIRTIIERLVKNLVRHHFAQKRNALRCGSLGSPQRGEDERGLVSEHDVTDDHHDQRLGIQSRSDQERSELQQDLATVMAQLPAHMQETCERLRTQSISQVAEELGIPRTTLTDWLRQVRKCFENANLQRYL